jgi:hypothetical protein
MPGRAAAAGAPVRTARGPLDPEVYADCCQRFAQFVREVGHAPALQATGAAERTARGWVAGDKLPDQASLVAFVDAYGAGFLEWVFAPVLEPTPSLDRRLARLEVELGLARKGLIDGADLTDVLVAQRKRADAAGGAGAGGRGVRPGAAPDPAGAGGALRDGPALAPEPAAARQAPAQGRLARLGRRTALTLMAAALGYGLAAGGGVAPGEPEELVRPAVRTVPRGAGPRTGPGVRLSPGVRATRASREV